MADNKVNFLRGTSAEYETKTKDNDTFYYTTDTKKLYLGENEITGIEIDDTSTTAIDKTWSAKKINDSIPTSLPANGGNADTVDSKHASDFMQNLGYLNTGSLLDYVLTMTESGYLFVSDSVTDTPVSGQFFFVDVRRYAGGHYAITATRFNAGGVYTNRYNNNSDRKKWYGWSNVADGGTVASSTSSGIVSTGKQHFKGQKLFDDSVWIPNPNIVMGNGAPSADTSRVFAFMSSDDSMNNASAYMQNVARAAGNNELYLVLRSLTSKTAIIGLGIKINADGSNHYTYVTNPPKSTQSALRNISSGTATATTTNCPSGSWYGKHS